MRNRTFWDMKLSLEEEELKAELTEVDGGDAIDIDEVISMEEVQEEVAEISEDIENDTAVVEDSVEVVEDLQEQADANDELLENHPEKVTEEVVNISQEAFVVKLGMLNYPLEEIKKLRVSNESDVPAVTRLRLNNESIKETITKIWEKIKAVFAKIGASIKEFIQKAMLAVDAISKKALALTEKVKMDNKDYVINADMINKYGGLVGVVVGSTPKEHALHIYKQYVAGVAGVAKYNKGDGSFASEQLKLFNTVNSKLSKQIQDVEGVNQTPVMAFSKDDIIVYSVKENGVGVDTIKVSLEDVKDVKLNNAQMMAELKLIAQISKQFKDSAKDASGARDHLYKVAATAAKEDDMKTMKISNTAANTVVFKLLSGCMSDINRLLKLYNKAINGTAEEVVAG